MKTIKTKVVNKDIRALDRTANISRNTKNTFIRTKEQTEQFTHSEESNYVAEAENKPSGKKR